MIYSILKNLIVLTKKVFFRSVSVRNKHLIPAKGPLMILANHPSTFMDPIVIAAMLDREVYFLAKGELFKGGLANWLLPKLNMIPVYRKQDDPNQMSKNEDTFKKCFEHLEKGGAILMFPEGTSITERKLRPIKTGASRIVLGAEARNNFQLNTQIITIGLNYANPHKFNRDLFINIDEPIKAVDFKESYSEDTFKGAEKLTEAIRASLEKLIIDIDDEKTDSLVKDIEKLYKRKVSKDLGITEKNKEAEFVITKNIAESVNYFITHQPARAEKMRLRIKEYLNNLSQLGLKDSDLTESGENKSLIGGGVKALLAIIAGFPIYIYGLLNNFLPFEIPGWLAKKITSQLEFRGPISMVIGIFTFLFFYSLQIMLVWKFSHIFWLSAVYGITLPLTGIFAYWYYHLVVRIHSKWLMMKIFYTKSLFIANLVTEREKLIFEFDKAKDEYFPLQK